jgi:serine/threonine-protein kinase
VISFLDRWSEVDPLLERALDLTAGRRESYLEGVCAGDSALRRQLGGLLRLAQSRQTTLEGGAARLLPPEAEEASSWSGRRVGPYRLERELGSGGMGTVWLARRDDGQFERRVAVKVVRPDRPSEELLARFHHERRILASLEHPNIARLLDGGATEEGLPYLVMEHVEGEPITEHCARRGLAVGDRLALFVTVCEAVQSAHQALVVHRDLKPSNILVTPSGEVKLLDFGIAKLLERGGERGALTRTGSEPLTPAFASPEQLRGEPATTAADVYGLGVLLFRLLTERPPYPVDRGLAETVRAVLEDPPPIPSETVPPARRPRLAGDLDAIVLKALACEPSARYATARELADDLVRHRDGLPVAARPADWRYRLGKLLRRRRAALASTAGAVALLAGLGALHAARLAEERDRAEAEAAAARAVSGFVVDLFGIADPDARQGEALSALDLLEAGRSRLASLDLPAGARAELGTALGVLYARLGRYGEAAELLETAIATRRRAETATPALAESLYELGVVRRRQGALDDAERLHREALELRRAATPADDWAVAESTNELGLVAWERGDYAAAESIHRETLALRRAVVAERGDPDLDLTASLNNLGLALLNQGRPDEALPLLEELVALRRARFGAVHSRVATALGNLALAYTALARYPEAERAYRESLAQDRDLFGELHPKVAGDLVNLAAALHNQGRTEEAAELARRSLELRRELLGPDHRETLTSQSHLANQLHGLGRSAEAEALLRDALGRRRAAGPLDHPDAARDLRHLSGVIEDRGRLAEAEALAREALELDRRILGDEHPQTAASQLRLGDVLAARGRAADAAGAYRAAVTILTARYGAEHPRSLAARERLAAVEPP